jgi:excisionase family DNA binding protein
MGFNEIYRSVLKDYPDILTVEEMSQALGVSTKTGYRLLRDNKIEHLKMGRTYRIPKAHLLTYLRVFTKPVPVE